MGEKLENDRGVARPMPLDLNAAAPLGVRLRPMTDADLPFAAALYASTRAEELAQTGWSMEQQQAFLATQHEAQHHHYRTHYDGAEWLIVEREGEAIGRLYLVEWPRELRIIDIALVPDAKAQGIGGALLVDIMARAAGACKAVTAHVERNNPALRLYDRLGFTLAEDKGVYLLLEWRPRGTERN
jgi:ribosomal protein S18 acetylase RimI-like enzyme